MFTRQTGENLFKGCVTKLSTELDETQLRDSKKYFSDFTNGLAKPKIGYKFNNGNFLLELTFITLEYLELLLKSFQKNKTPGEDVCRTHRIKDSFIISHGISLVVLQWRIFLFFF